MRTAVDLTITGRKAHLPVVQRLCNDAERYGWTVVFKGRTTLFGGFKGTVQVEAPVSEIRDAVQWAAMRMLSA